MELISTKVKIFELLDLKHNNILSVNPEYQRGAVWNVNQQKKLIDSVLRGYPLPLIYLHYKKKIVAGMQREDLEIIDGQQRINALYEFREVLFELFDPILDDKIARFPAFVKATTCPWARRTYLSLDLEFKNKFNDTEIFIVKVITDIEDEARDLFIRLQAGLPLNAQEKRDAWPGAFTEFVLKLGGKKKIIRYPGHSFFQKLIYTSSTDRGDSRQLCAQIAMLYFEEATEGNWVDIGTQPLDDYYYRNLSFDIESPKVLRFTKVLNLITDLFTGYKGPKLKGHEAIHIVLLVDSLLDDYTKSWETDFIKAFDNFRSQSVLDKKRKEGDYWFQYGVLTQTQSSNARSIQLRHKFFLEKMFPLLTTIKKDVARIYGRVEREIIYFRDSKKCAVCNAEIKWEDLEIHHIEEHHKGGQTIIENGVSVHTQCHPKGQKAIEFNKKWKSNSKEPDRIEEQFKN